MRILKTALVSLAAAVALAYALGFDYLFKGIRETYLRGTTGSSIDDGTYFPSHRIPTGKVIPWEKDSAYNEKQLPNALLQQLQDTNSASFIVIKNGKIAHEQYWDGYTADSQTNSFSMAKAVTVMLVGKAIEEKKIKSLDQRFLDFYRDFEGSEFGSSLTLHDLAAMEAGLDWDEDYKNPFLPNAKAYYGRSLEQAVLRQKFTHKPGSRFEYQSGATQLLGFALRKSLDKTVAAYLAEKFWQPLGMEHSATWSTDQFGMEKTFCCINAASRDFAKLGQLFLNEGLFNGQQLLSKDFVTKMHTPTRLSGGAYGLGLWVNEDASIRHYYFRGLYGQYIIIVPSEQMVIVRTGMDKSEAHDSKGRPKQVEYLVSQAAAIFK